MNSNCDFFNMQKFFMEDKEDDFSFHAHGNGRDGLRIKALAADRMTVDETLEGWEPMSWEFVFNPKAGYFVSAINISYERFTDIETVYKALSTPEGKKRKVVENEE